MPLIQLAIKIRGSNINSPVSLATVTLWKARGHVRGLLCSIDCVYKDRGRLFYFVAGTFVRMLCPLTYAVPDEFGIVREFDCEVKG